MSIFKMINDAKNSPEQLEYIVKYATTKPYCDFEKNVATMGCRKDSIIPDFKAIKNVYHKPEGKQYVHQVLSITPDRKSITDEVYMELGRRIAQYNDGYQCVYTLHKDTSYRHLHFIFNTVAYKDGKRYSSGPPDLQRVRTYINGLLEKEGFDPIRFKLEDMVDSGEHYFDNGWGFLEISDDSPDPKEDIFADPPGDKGEDSEDKTTTLIPYYGGNNMENFNITGYLKPYSNFTPKLAQDSIPTVTYSRNDTYGKYNRYGKGVNLTYQNNVILEKYSDLGPAVEDLSKTFDKTAVAAANALATLRMNGINEGVNVNTINNFVFGNPGGYYTSPQPGYNSGGFNLAYPGYGSGFNSGGFNSGGSTPPLMSFWY